MKNQLWAGLLGMTCLALMGCGKKEEIVAAAPAAPKPLTIAVVKATERSRHFLAVNQQLELGGTLYGYADIDGDMLKLAGTLQSLLDQVAAAQPAAAPYLKQDYAALFTTLGLNDIKAVGFSSVPDGTGYFRNRAFFYTPDKRHGLLASFGGAPAPFARLGLAPADTDVYAESEVDLPAVYATVREVVAKIGGDKAADTMEAQLKRSGEAAAFSAYSFIEGLKGRVAVVLRLDAEKQMKLPIPPGVTLPGLSLMICLDGVGPTVEPALMKSPLFKAVPEGAVHWYELTQPVPVEGIQPVLVVDGTSLYIATSRKFLEECRHPAAGGLAERPEFKAALARVGPEGNALSYVSPHFFAGLRQIETLNPQLPADTKRIITQVLGSLPKADRPLVTVRRNLPDGILVNSYWDRSLKQNIAALMIYNPVTIGVVAAMAVPAFQKVRASSQEKAVLNNLRQLAAAADRYYLEHGVTAAKYDDLVGPDKYIKVINPVVGENYHRILFRQGAPLRVRVPALQKVVQYGP